MVEIKSDILPNGVHRFEAVDEGRVVGSLFIDPSDPEGFGPIQVNPTHRRHGIGSMLLDAAKELIPGTTGQFVPEIGTEQAGKRFYLENGFTFDGNILRRR